MIKKAVFILAVAILLTAPAMALEGSPSTPTAPTYNTDSNPSPEVAPGYYGKMLSPVMSKFNLTIGGYIKLDYTYNSGSYGNSIPAMENIQQAPRVGTDAYNQEQSLLTARQSRIWFKVGGPTFLGAKTNALLEIDFYGSGGTNEASIVRMRHAMGTIDWTNTQILFGQFWDIFGPAVMNTIDFGSGAATGAPNSPRVSQLRLTQKVNMNDTNSLKFVVGVQSPTQDGVTDTAGNADYYGSMVNVAGQVMFTSKALGTAPGYYGQSMNNLTVGAFGLYGSSKTKQHNQAIDAYGYGLYAFIPVLKSKDGKSREMTMSLEGQGYIASGMKFNNATAQWNTGDLPEKKGAMGYGVYGQLIFYPTQNLGLTTGYGHREATQTANYSDWGTNGTYERFNEVIYANVAYDLNAAIRVAAEYEYLRTKWDADKEIDGRLNRELGQANAIHLAAYYFF